MTKKLVIGIGEALWDMLPSGKKVGGAPANFAYHASQFGLESMAVSALGDDALGRELLSEYAKAGLNVHMQTAARPTGTVAVSIDANGIPSYDICRDVAWDNIEWNAELERIAEQTSVVCFGSLAQRSPVSHDSISKFIKTMPDGPGQLKIFDINLRQSYYSKSLVEENLRRCNILKINDEEIITVRDLFGWGNMDIKACVRRLLNEYALEIVILTCGAEGSYVLSRNGESEMKTPKVEVKDTVGAGDSFTGAFVAALVQGRSIREAHELAVKVAAYVCTQDGAMPKIPENINTINLAK